MGRRRHRVYGRRHLLTCPGSPVLYQTTTPLGGPLGLDAGNRHRNQIIAGVDAVGYRAKWPSRARVRHFYRHFKGIALLIGISRRQAAPMSSRRNSLIRCWTKTTRVAPTGNGPLTVADALRFVLFARLLFPSIEPQRILIRLKANPKLQHQLLERPAPERQQASPGVSLQQSPKGLAVVGTKPRTCCRPNSQAPKAASRP